MPELPEEVQELLHIIVVDNRGNISEPVQNVLLKLWNREELTEAEKDLDISSAEVAGVWSVTHRRPLSVETVRQATTRRTGSWKDSIKPSKEWGSGTTKRRLYRLEDVLNVQVQARKKKDAQKDKKQADPLE